MFQATEPNPARRRAGLLSALSRMYNDAHNLMNQDASKEDIEKLYTKLEEQYNKYLESHDLTLAEQPERKAFLMNSLDLNVQRHRKIVGQLSAYLEDGTKPDDLESLHAASLFSFRSNTKRSVAQSCPAIQGGKTNTASHLSQARSATVSETRVQAKLAKHRFAQQQAEQEANQRKIDFEREVARQNRELDKRREEAEERERKLQVDAAQMQLEAKRLQEELDLKQRQVQLDVERQQRELDQRQRELKEEAELRKQELENEIQLKRQKHEMENLENELRLREREEIRQELGSDYDSDDDREDVTRLKESTQKYGHQLESDQNVLLQEVLRKLTDNPKRTVPEFGATRDPVANWFSDPVEVVSTPATGAFKEAPQNMQRRKIPLPKNLLPTVPEFGEDTFEGCNCGYAPPVTGLRKDGYSEKFSDKLQSNRQAISEFEDQNVCDARRDYLQPSKFSDAVAPTRTFSDIHSRRLAKTDAQNEDVCATRCDFVQPKTKLTDSRVPTRTLSENYYATNDSERSGKGTEKKSETPQRSNTTIDSSHPGTSKSDAALFSRALIEHRMPTPKQLEFDGNPKTFKAFLASFKTNIESKLKEDTEEDAALKLTYLLQHCTGDAKYLIDDCAMLDPFSGFEIAMERLQARYGQGHVIARSFIESVRQGPKIKLNDVSALMKLETDMVKCQTVLSRLEFTSDLDSTGTLASIVNRLPDSFQLKWARRSSKILQGGRDTKFYDLVAFVKEEAIVYSSKFGQMYAESKITSNKPSSYESSKKEKSKEKVKVTTLATSARESTAGPSSSAKGDQKQKIHCDNCDIPGHFIGRCHKFKRLKREDKLEIVKKKNLCFCCLKAGHGSKDCDRRCVKCEKKHHVLIHSDKEYSEKFSDEMSSKATTATEAVTCSTSKIKSDATLGALPVRVKVNGKEKLVVALVDTGSNTTLIRRSLVDELGISGEQAAPVAVHTMNGPALQQDGLVCKLELMSDDRTSSVIVDEALTVPAIPVRAVVDGKAFNEYPHLRDLDLPYIPRAKIGIIIGTDCPEMHWSLEERRAGRKDPIARRTPLGWIVLGPSEKTDSIQSLATSVGADPLAEQLRQISLLDFQDTIVTEPAMSVDDRRALKTMQETVKLVDGKYQIGIPWKVDPVESLQNNRSMAEARLRMLKRKFAANKQLAEDYSNTVEAYISDGHAKLVEDHKDSQVQWFLPHHAVFKRSDPTKCRVVFDCAAQYKGISLNDAILQGPNYLNNLAGVLVRFRKEPVAVIGDIKAMFHQCFVQPDDTRFLRFLWWPGGDTSVAAKVYAMQVHLFGGKSSPSVVNFCMRKTADDHELKYSELAISTLRRSFYMDDMIRSVKCVEDAKQLIPEMQKLLHEGGFDLGKFMSTSREVIETVSEERRAKSLQNIDLNDCITPSRVCFRTKVERRR